VRDRLRVGPLGLRALCGWASLASIPFGVLAVLTGAAYSVAFASTIGVAGVSLALFGLWLQLRVEVKVDPDIDDPKAPR
jgi:hypothetical protein